MSGKAGAARAGDYRTRIVADIRTLSAATWDALAGDAGPGPFVRHAFLAALQTAGCVGDDTGWHPHFVCIEDASGALVGAAPLYLKAHSYGEYVFDWAWADAYRRHGLEYYPKALVAIPFTPVPGARLLARDDAARAALVQALLAECESHGLSSLHVLFPREADAQALAAAGLMRRLGVQFHWSNPGWKDFDDYLGALAQPKRKKIRAERRKVAEAGVTVAMLEGPAITEADWTFFARCYRTTYAQHHSTPYLNRAFFIELARSMPEALLMARASREGRPIAAALLMRDSQAIYGRYWGAIEHVPCLHFEASYYAPIEWAIAQGVARFEGGAQGEHKMARGFLPVPTCSYHHLAHPAFADAVERFLEREAGGVDAYLDELDERSPLRRAGLAPSPDAD
ncbi:MAG: GNAT family N-acetyltransferase [Burkholderiales bacterium]|nr:GNAT family N-acetyltransferase [Burkholderiales bacterium]